MNWTVLLAATDQHGGVSNMYETELEADGVEAAFKEALKSQTWTPDRGGFLVSRLTSEAGEDRVVVHENGDPLKCWLS